MKLNVTHCQLHSVLFLGGKNHGTSLKGTKTGEPKKDLSTVLTYDTDAKHLIVEYNKKMCVVPDVHAFEPEFPQEMGIKGAADQTKAAPKQKSHAMTKAAPMTAQVSTPHDHVFAGQGAGKTNDK